jgi:hypothetical protein
MRRKILLLCCMAFSLAICHANNSRLYADESPQNEKSTISDNGLYSQEQSQTLTDDTSGGLFGEDDETLYAPPGGGAPIGGVPVENGYIVLSILGSGYFFFKKRRKA